MKTSGKGLSRERGGNGYRLDLFREASLQSISEEMFIHILREQCKRRKVC
jgi:hypothetical protein